MDWYMVVLRIVHILTGAFWVGAAYTTFAFIVPTSQAIGADSQRFMEQMMGRRRFPTIVLTATVFTVVSGILLYWRDSNGFSSPWMSSPTGIGFSIGALAAIVSFLIGPLVLLPTFNRLGALGAQIAAAGGPPSAEQMSELHTLQRRIRNWGIADLVFLTIAVFFMAISRYLG